jgi:excisionase family DNA binding protein
VSDGEREVLTPAEVARMLRVNSKTVGRWEKDRKLTPAYRTPGGHRRYYADEIEALLNGTRTGTCPACQYDVSSQGHRVSCGGTS